jgi:hypothetical protein
MRNDPRWTTEVVPGNGGKTMDRLYRDAGSPPYNAGKSASDRVNRTWVEWYAQVAQQAADGALNEAAYEPIRRAWRGCLSSNFATSARYDGKGSPPRLDHAPNDWEIGFASYGFGDLQAPVLYWARERVQRQLGGTLMEASLERARRTVDANVMSFGGPHHDVVPWLLMIGYSGYPRAGEGTVTAEHMKNMLTMLKERRVQEFILWSDASTQRTERNWDQLVQVIGQLWP